MPFTWIALSLLVAVALISVFAQRSRMTSSILLLLVGTLISFIPGTPLIELDHEVVLTLLLPPLLYSSGVGMSWRGFRFNLRPILLLAIGCVLFTASAVAAVVHWAFGVPLAVGFVLGAIVSPPDSVAPMAILRRLGLPRRVLTVLEGESLVNDATALVILSFAIGAVSTGAFSLPAALVKFAAITFGELAWGIGVGAALLWLRHAARDPKAEVLLALATPFIAFWPPHQIGGSGVIACVAAGLWVSWNGRRLIRPATRLQGYFIWGLVTWAIEGLVFLLTGLQAKSVIVGVESQGWPSLLAAAALVSATVIIVRFVWVYPATYLPRVISARLRKRDPHPHWRLPTIIGFTGLRGVVSLAAALSVPLTLAGGPFPGRDWVLFLTFCVIFATLVGQGAALPWVVRALGLVETGAAEHRANQREEQAVRLDAIDAVLAEIRKVCMDGAPTPAVEALRRRHEDRRQLLATSADQATPDDPLGDTSTLQLHLLGTERAVVADAYDAGRLTDEARRRIEREFDLEEARALHEGTATAAAGGE